MKKVAAIGIVGVAAEVVEQEGRQLAMSLCLTTCQKKANKRLTRAMKGVCNNPALGVEQFKCNSEKRSIEADFDRCNKVCDFGTADPVGPGLNNAGQAGIADVVAGPGGPGKTHKRQLDMPSWHHVKAQAEQPGPASKKWRQLFGVNNDDESSGKNVPFAVPNYRQLFGAGINAQDKSMGNSPVGEVPNYRQLAASEDVCRVAGDHLKTMHDQAIQDFSQETCHIRCRPHPRSIEPVCKMTNSKGAPLPGKLGQNFFRRGAVGACWSINAGNTYHEMSGNIELQRGAINGEAIQIAHPMGIRVWCKSIEFLMEDTVDTEKAKVKANGGWKTVERTVGTAYHTASVTFFRPQGNQYYDDRKTFEFEEHRVVKAVGPDGKMLEEVAHESHFTEGDDTDFMTNSGTIYADAGQGLCFGLDKEQTPRLMKIRSHGAYDYMNLMCAIDDDL